MRAISSQPSAFSLFAAVEPSHTEVYGGAVGAGKLRADS
jgi:hypothetical protein